jgi:hypothetical protein
MKSAITALLVYGLAHFSSGQSISSSLPSPINKSSYYLFYLHGAIVQDQGANAVSKDFGPYKYRDILDSLKSREFYVISEVRTKGTETDGYGTKIKKQVDSLLNSGVMAAQITLVGASAGAYMVVDAAIKLQNPKLNFVVMGMCWPDTYKEFSGKKLCGNFLSIYEASDPHGSCEKLFQQKNCDGKFKEVVINTGKSHGFLYQPYKDWIDPVVEFALQKK